MLSTSIYYSLRKGLATCKTVTGNKSTLLHHIVFERINGFQTVFRTTRTNAQSRAPIKGNSLRSIDGDVPQDSIPIRNIYKAFAFTGVFSLSCFLGASVLEYENTRNLIAQRATQTKTFWSRYKVVHQNAWEIKKSELKKFWNDLMPSQRVFIPICALNILVFGLWRIPSMRQFMTTYFCSNPAARVVAWPMVLSTFSHYSPMHLFANMYVLQSFSGPAVAALGEEQFLAMYLTAGVFSSFTSYFHKYLTSTPGLSLGASGAIMAILAFVCANYPETQLSVLFLPMYTFSAGSALKFIMGIDIAGCMFGWKFFDHAAHLGGAVFGLFWVYYGKQIWDLRMPFLKQYHQWRHPKK